MVALGAGITMAIAALGTSISIGILAAKAMEGIARQPEAGGMIRGAMILAIVFIEAIALYALVLGILIYTKI